MAITEILAEHIQNPDLLAYRQEMKGPINPEAMLQAMPLLNAIRTQATFLVQSNLAEKLYKLASQREKTWALASEKKAWSKSRANMIRCMLRDVQQSWVKVRGKGPDWLQHFPSGWRRGGGRGRGGR